MFITTLLMIGAFWTLLTIGMISKRKTKTKRSDVIVWLLLTVIFLFLLAYTFRDLFLK